MAYDETTAHEIRAHLHTISGITEKKLFGGIGFMLHGNMACGLNGADLIVRLGQAEFIQAMQQPHVRVFDLSGRPMQGWILVAPAGYTPEAALKAWVEKGVQFARSLAPQ